MFVVKVKSRYNVYSRGNFKDLYKKKQEDMTWLYSNNNMCKVQIMMMAMMAFPFQYTFYNDKMNIPSFYSSLLPSHLLGQTCHSILITQKKNLFVLLQVYNVYLILYQFMFIIIITTYKKSARRVNKHIIIYITCLRLLLVWWWYGGGPI